MNRLFKSALFGLLIMPAVVLAAKVDTVTTKSISMNKEIKAVIVTPDKYSENEKYPVVYLLHGYSGNYSNWITEVPEIKAYADLYNLIIVCPDGDYNSWYWDSPEDENVRYETYVASELVSWVDDTYSTLDSPKGRAITGLSMGGHGALYLAFRHQDVYGSAGSMSGGVDIGPFPDNWDMKDQLGTKARRPDRWKTYSVMGQLHLLTPKSLSLIIECGTDDFFYDVNFTLHQQLLTNRIPHTFTSSPGGHSWEFWSNAVKYQLLFFHEHFAKNQ